MSKPIEIVREIVQGDLGRCDAEQLAAFQKYGVDPYLAPILRYGKIEAVVVVARRDDEVIYWEDIEEGFNLSSLSPDGQVLQHWCNQDEFKPCVERVDSGKISTRDGRPSESH